jgi:hypothetical protein
MEPGLELFLFQEEGIRFASEREGALIADEMGLGKSRPGHRQRGSHDSESRHRDSRSVFPAFFPHLWDHAVRHLQRRTEYDDGSK